MMRRLTSLTAVLCVALATAAAAVAATARSSATTLSIMAPYTGADEQSFRAVLSGFRAENSGLEAVYTPSGADLAAALTAAVKKGTAPDVAILHLPDQSGLLRSLAKSGGVQPISFVAAALDKNYAFTWKMLGSAAGKIYGLPFKVDDESAFWYDTALFKRAGIESPTTWAGLQRISHALLAMGIKPFAVAGGDGASLSAIFANVYLAQQGQSRYDRLGAHAIRWTDPSVKAALSAMSAIVRPGVLSRTIARSMSSDFPSTAMQLFGVPHAAMLFGGSNVFPFLRSAVAARPVSQFGAFAFPRIGSPPARVVGGADVVVMLKDSPAAESLIQYLATPDAATIWAKRGGFLSPNNKVTLASYPSAASRTMAGQLIGTTTFRLDLAGLMPQAFRTKLSRLLQAYVKSPAQIDKITKQLEAAAPSA